jgi:hypothetical protein
VKGSGRGVTRLLVLLRSASFLISFLVSSSLDASRRVGHWEGTRFDPEELSRWIRVSERK